MKCKPKCYHDKSIVIMVPAQGWGGVYADKIAYFYCPVCDYVYVTVHIPKPKIYGVGELASVKKLNFRDFGY
jgi:hypothetical protein